MRIFVLAVTLVGVIGCSSSRGRPAYDPTAVTLCVQNATVGYGNVVAYAGSTRFTVYPGEEVCKDLRPVGGGLPIRAATTGGGAAGPLRFSFQLPGGPGCWHWRVSTSRAVDVVSCDEGDIY